MPPQVALGDIAQLLIGIAAISALFLGPAMGFRNSRRFVIAASRQSWLDDLRGDIARIVALHNEVVIHRAKQKRLANKAPDPPELLRELGELSARVRMRLNMKEPLHARLNQEVARYITNYEEANPNELICAMDPIVGEVWKDIKSGKL